MRLQHGICCMQSTSTDISTVSRYAHDMSGLFMTANNIQATKSIDAIDGDDVQTWDKLQPPQTHSHSISYVLCAHIQYCKNGSCLCIRYKRSDKKPHNSTMHTSLVDVCTAVFVRRRNQVTHCICIDPDFYLRTESTQSMR